MKITLERVDPHNPIDLYLLYKLLGEREPHQSISHKIMPSWKQHVAFVESHPYDCWFIIMDANDPVGATYLTKHAEIGIGILREFQGKGYATAAIKELMSVHSGNFYANINPENEASIALFKKLGFELLQVTYHHE